MQKQIKFHVSLKIFIDYAISLLLFVVFIPLLFSLGGDSYYNWLSFYSFVFFLLMFYMIYSDCKELAFKEKRPQYNLKSYPLKGFVSGLLAFLPIILIEVVYPFVKLEGELPNRIKHLILNTSMGPLYSIIRLGSESPYAYAAATLVVPAIAMIGYLFGFYGIEPYRQLKKLRKGKDDANKKVSK